MATADTAKLLASLDLKDNLTPGVQKAIGSTKTLESRFASLGSGAAKMGGTVSKGLSNLAGNLSRIGIAAAASLGVAGIFSVGGAFEAAITKAKDFGETVDKTMSLTGLGVSKASALASALSYVGVNGDSVTQMLGMAEKNLAALTATTKKATDFQKTYSISLTDTNGKTIDANELLLRSADLYTSKAIPASTKALALSKIYGKAWQNNIEVFELGRAKLAQVETEMQAAGLTMTPQNMKDWEKFRDISRSATGALSGLELQLGMLIMPDLASGMETFTNYVRTHQSDIKEFFKNGIQAAKDLAGFVTGTVIPVLSTIAGTAAKIWGSIPAPMQQLLAGGFVLNKLTGGAVSSLIGQLGSGLKGVLGINAGVVNINAAVVNGGGGLPGGGGIPGQVVAGAEGAGGAAVVGNTGAMLAGGTAVAIGGALSIGAVAAVAGVAIDQYGKLSNQGDALAAQAREFVKTADLPALERGQAAVLTAVHDLQSQAGYNPLAAAGEGGLGEAGKIIAAAIASYGKGSNVVLDTNRKGELIAQDITTGHLSAQIGAALQHPLQANAVDMGHEITSAFKQSMSPNLRSMTSAMERLRQLQEKFNAQGDTALAAKLGSDITYLAGRVDAVTQAINLKQFVATGILGSPSLTGNTPGATPVTIRDIVVKGKTAAAIGKMNRIGG